ncbi:hypothetical protein WICPIJ_000544 [Wickerhamomyces pijperi]|uniref:Zn(2)-C6 fungal-type domain-containing protein n=1 Tax=Wickerhamomyces pijperi TaxID=599730 RepID=A0A9P8QDK0_WICPI|nr:hypothetical protein WICPIJ_000544 [Wickerhamomyces pijperi]
MTKRAPSTQTGADTAANATTSATKRQRIIRSCINCRARKLKCDQSRPICNKCLKSNLEDCHYISGEDETSIACFDRKIMELQEALDSLYKEKCEAQTSSVSITNTSAPATDNLFNRQYLVGSTMSGTAFVRKYDPFYKAMLENCEFASRNAALPVNSTSKDKSSSQSTEHLQAKIIKHGIPLYLLIKPHLKDFQNVQSLVRLFFESELCCVYSFLNKSSFIGRFYDLYDDTHTIRDDVCSTGSDYIFLGQLLLVMKMSILSRYNYNNTVMSDFDQSGLDLVPLANLCVAEVSSPILEKNNIMSYAQLLLLLNYYQLHTPEFGSNTSDYLQFDISGLVKTCLIARYNVDPSPSDPQCHMIRKIWFHVLELSYIKFVKDGDPLITSSIPTDQGQMVYTTKLPSLSMAEDDMDRAVIRNMETRREIHVYFQRVFDLASNVVNPPPLAEIRQSYIHLMNVMTKIGLPKAVTKQELNSMDQRTNSINRLSRLFQISNFLDVYSLIFSLSVPLFYNYKAIKDFGTAQEILMLMTKGACAMLPLNYFMDVSSSSTDASGANSFKYNINVQFGHSVHLMGSILECCNKIIVVLITVLSRVCYYGMVKTEKESIKYQVLEDVIFNNLKVLLFNIGKLSNRYLFAKEIHLLTVFKIIMNFGKEQKCHLTKGYLKLLQQNEMLRETTAFDEDICEVITNIGSLKGHETPQGDPTADSSTFKITDDGFLSELQTSNQSIDLYFEKLFHLMSQNGNMEILENIISKGSFLEG